VNHRSPALTRADEVIGKGRADGGYTGWLVAFAATVLALALTIVKHRDISGFTVLPRRCPRPQTCPLPSDM
jgi:hypothetical protein